MCPALPLIPSDRPFTCLRSPSYAGTGLRGLVASSLHPASRRASRRWSWNFSKGSPMSAMRSRGGLRMSGMGGSDLCEGPCVQLCAGRVRPCERLLSQISLWVFSRFVCFCDICHFRRAGMSYRVDSYSLSSGGSIDWVPGVVPAAWGGPWRAWRAVRAAPKTRNCGTSRVKKTGPQGPGTVS
jgi:hypothetical protein